MAQRYCRAIARFGYRFAERVPGRDEHDRFWRHGIQQVRCVVMQQDSWNNHFRNVPVNGLIDDHPVGRQSILENQS